MGIDAIKLNVTNFRRRLSWASCLSFGALARATGGLVYSACSATLILGSAAFAKPRSETDVSFENWLTAEKAISIQRLMANISPAGARAGVVIASPSQDHPNYYFHWVRDASLTINTVVTLAEQARGAEQKTYTQAIENFVRLSAEEQAMNLPNGLGEPRFNVDGSVDSLPWARPQTDGPALRAITLMHYLRSFPDNTMPIKIMSVIYADLDFLARHYSEPSFDLWEELAGDHFYTQSAQYAALREGAELFGSDFFASAAIALKAKLSTYWQPDKNYIGASRNLQVDPLSPYKKANLDTATLLAVLHTGDEFGYYAINDFEVAATALALEKMFARLYKLNTPEMPKAVNRLETPKAVEASNAVETLKAPAIGRFEDDVYFNGNPWYMTTAAMAEYHYRLAAAVATKVTPATIRAPAIASTESASALITKGDRYMKTIQAYVGPNGEMAEQFDRNTGTPLSARDLTWSYAGFLSALEARTQALAK